MNICSRENNPSVNKILTPFFRRSIGLIFAGLPFAIASASIFSSSDPLFPKIASVFAALAILFGILNFWIIFIRPTLWRLVHRNEDGFKPASGIPILGTIFALAALFSGFGSNWIGVSVLVAVILDTGGISWFVFCTWADRSFWDNEISNQD